MRLLFEVQMNFISSDNFTLTAAASFIFKEILSIIALIVHSFSWPPLDDHSLNIVVF